MSIVALLILTVTQSQTPADLYKSYRQKIAEAKTITGIITEVMPRTGTVRSEFFFEKPDKFYIGNPYQTFIRNGQKVWQIVPAAGGYNEPPIETYGKGPGTEPFMPFWDGVEPKRAPYEVKIQDYDGKPMLHVVEVKKQGVTLTGIIDIETLLPHAWIQDLGGDVLTLRYSDVKLNQPVAASRFELPKDVKPMPDKKAADNLLPVGSKAPSFTLDTPAGTKVELAKELKDAKILWLNFWFYACGPCQAEIPKLHAIYEKLKNKGLKVIAVNRGDTAKLINAFMKEKSYTFPTAMDQSGGPDVSKLYGVDGYPTNYLIAPDGKILRRFTGFDEKAVLEELEKVGLKP